MRTSHWSVVGAVGVALAVAVAGPYALAGKPGGGGGGGGGGNPPADPAIAFAKYNKKSKNYDLAVMNADGSNQRTVVAGAWTGAPYVDWAPDGSKLVFNGTLQGRGIYVVNVDGSGLVKLASVSAVGLPRWSPATAPDGQYKIAFADDVGGDGDVFVMNVDGTGLTNLTQTTGVGEGYVAWDPTATRIAVKRRDGVAEAVTVLGLTSGSGGIEVSSTTDVTGVAGSPLTSSDHYLFLDWSRTSDRIAVSVYQNTTSEDLWVIDAASPASPVRLTNTSRTEEREASWSPDDSELVFWLANPPGAGGLAKIDVSSGAVTSMGINGQAPAWRR